MTHKTSKALGEYIYIWGIKFRKRNLIFNEKQQKIMQLFSGKIFQKMGYF